MRESKSVFFPVLAAGFLLAPVVVSGGIRMSSSLDAPPKISSPQEIGVVGHFQFVQLAAGEGKQTSVPPVRVQAQVGTQQRRIGNSYRKQMEINPRIVLEGANKGLPLPELEAVMIIVTMDTRAKYVQRREVYRVESAQTIQIPAATNGERREIQFDQSIVSFDAWRDQTNVGGKTYKYFVFGLRDPQTKTLLDFQTNNPQLASLGKSSPQRREEFLSLGKGAEFPATIK